MTTQASSSSDSRSLDDALWALRDEIGRRDARAYPTRSFRQGVHMVSLEEHRVILKGLFAVGAKINQRHMEDGFTALDRRCNQALSKLCVITSVNIVFTGPYEGRRVLL